MEISILADVILLLLLVIVAIAIIMARNLMTATILLTLFSLLMASTYLILGAPDVAITEAAIGAGISTILLLAALLITGEKEKPPKHPLLPLIVVTVTGGVLIYATLGLPALGEHDSVTNSHLAPYYLEKSGGTDGSGGEIGIPNVVTSILASYRGFDTLGEVFVVFTAAISLLLLLGDRKKKTIETRKVND